MGFEKFDQLLAAFNRGSLDIPDGFLSSNTTYSINGVSYEALIGRSTEEPLIRMLTRGAAAYRTAAKALQYALHHPVMTLETLSPPDEAGARTAHIRVEGRLRDTGVVFRSVFRLILRIQSDRVVAMDADCAPDDLRRISDARK